METEKENIMNDLQIQNQNGTKEKFKLLIVMEVIIMDLNKDNLTGIRRIQVRHP